MIISDLVIRELRKDEHPPMELLLLADPSEKMIRDYLANGRCYVLDTEHKIIAVIVIKDIGNKVAEIMNIAVDEAYQGKGIGKKLLLEAISIAKGQGIKKLVIGTGNSSIGQLGLYQKIGFRITGIEKGFFTKNYSDPIWENGIQCVDMIRLSLILT